jgi:hypothetical protein
MSGSWTWGAHQGGRGVGVLVPSTSEERRGGDRPGRRFPVSGPGLSPVFGIRAKTPGPHLHEIFSNCPGVPRPGRKHNPDSLVWLPLPSTGTTMSAPSDPSRPTVRPRREASGRFGACPDGRRSPVRARGHTFAIPPRRRRQPFASAARSSADQIGSGSSAAPPERLSRPSAGSGSRSSSARACAPRSSGGDARAGIS